MRIVITCVTALTMSLSISLSMSLSLSVAADEPARLEFRTHGFSIEAIEETSEATVQAVVMTLPPADGFAPNVNVQVQPFAGTLEGYMDLSRAQLKQVKFAEISTETKDDRSMFEYTGTTQGKDLHFYSVAKKRDGKIILVTATAMQSQWSSVSKKLMRCADSLKIEEAK